MQPLRIFVSSPGDVKEERRIAGEVIERLQGKYWSFVRLDDIFWEDKAIRSTGHYQDELVNPGDCEIVLGILWSRLGSRLPARFLKQTGERFESGTEWELEAAFDAYQKSIARGADRFTAKPDILIYRRKQSRPRQADPDQEAPAAEQESKLQGYLRENYWFPDGSIKRPISGYADVAEFEDKLSHHLEELVLRHIPSLKPGIDPPPISGSPFKGLQAFGFVDSDRYFGRNREIREIRELLLGGARRQFPFLLIYGASGYGKSSLMQAGLAPLVTRPGGSLDGIQGWRRISFQPARGEGTLVERFARTLLQPPSAEETERSRENDHWPRGGLAELSSPARDEEAWDATTLSSHFADEEKRAQAITAIVRTLESLDRHLLLELDQLEEIFTLPAIDESHRAAFLRTIIDLCTSGRVWTVATMRSEFFPRIAEQAELRELVGKDRGYILTPPDRQSLSEIIRYPALAARLDFERRIQPIEIAGEEVRQDYLHEQILADAETSPDALPLLEFTLQQLYNARAGQLLTWSAYAESGGLKGSIAKRAAEVYRTLGPAAQGTRDRIFSALVQIDPQRGTVTRRRAPLHSFEAHPGSESFLAAFLEARLLVTDEDEHTGNAIVVAAHDSLLSHWEELSHWIKDHQGDLLARQRLVEQTGLWVQSGKQKSYLLSEARLAEAGRIAESGLFTLEPSEIEYLNISRKTARQKLRFFQASAALFALLAIGAGILGLFAWRNAKNAIVQRDKAVKNRGQAERILEFLTYDLRDRLAPIGRSDIVADVQERVAGYYRELGVEEGELEQMEKRGVALNNEGDRLKLEGKLSDAAKVYAESLAISRRVFEKRPADLVSQRALAISQNRVASVLAQQGKWAVANDLYAESLKNIRKMIAGDPEHGQFQMDLAGALQESGKIFLLEGKLEQAAAYSAEALTIVRELTNDLADDGEAQFKLEAALRNAAEVALARGKLEEAEKSFAESLVVCRRFVSKDPDNILWLQSLEGTLSGAGKLLVEQKKWPEAVRAFSEGVDLSRKVARNDPAILSWQRNLSINLNRLGNALEDQGKIAEAAKAFAESLALLRKVVARYPEDIYWHRDLISAVEQAGRMCEQMGQLPEAEELFSEGVSVARTILASDPENIEKMDGVRYFLGKVVKMQMGQERWAQASVTLTDYLAVTRTLATLEPEKATRGEQVSDAVSRSAETLLMLGKPAEAAVAFDELLVQNRKLLAVAPDDPDRQEGLAFALNRVANAEGARNELEKAARLFAESLVIWRKLAAADPGNRERQEDLAATLSSLGVVVERQDVLTESQKFIAEALAIRRQLARQFPDESQPREYLESTIIRMLQILKARELEKDSASLYFELLEVRRNMAERDPANVRKQEDLRLALGWVMEIRERNGELEEMVLVLSDLLGVSKQLAKIDPKPERLLEVGSLTEVMGGLQLKRGETAKAAELFAECLAYMGKLPAKDLESPEWQRRRLTALVKAGIVAGKAGKRVEAKSYLAEAMDLGKKLEAHGSLEGDPLSVLREIEEAITELDK
ncbi:MAG: tetratricopeptide repeat protein [Verrucomicrobiales bacterium]